MFRSHPLQSTDLPHVLTFRKGDSALVAKVRRIALACLLSTLLPVAFGQMALTTAQKTDGPSLKETLDWLKEKIPLAANHYVFKGVVIPKDVTVRTLPTHFDSCTVSFDYTEVEIFEKHRDRPIVTTTRQTVPLGAVSGTKVINESVPVSLNDAYKIDKTVDRWIVSLDTTSKLVLSETHEDLNNTTTSESQNFAILVF